MSWDRERIFALLVQAGEIALGKKGRLRREYKLDRSIVTEADREIEALLARELERPEAGTYFIGEETLHEKGEPYLQAALGAEAYVVDPIDGTAPYAYSLPNWGISIGRMEKGVLTDGAVHLAAYGELVLSDGAAVLEYTRQGAAWTCRELHGPQRAEQSRAPLAITQGVAKRGRVLAPHPVMVLGSAVVPLIGLLQGRFAGYLGSVKLWDIGGALPLLLRKGFSATVLVGDEVRAVTNRVEEATYYLEAASRARWALRSNLLICHPDDELFFRAAFVKEERFADQE
jgi:fructose-1,6-bisphosphatase/inositol monophosphatase family enzyme